MGECGKKSEDKGVPRDTGRCRVGVVALGSDKTPQTRETVRLGIYSAVEWMGEAQRGASGRDQGPQLCTGSVSVVQRDVGAAEEPKGVQGCLGALGFRGRSGDPKVAQGPLVSYPPWQCLARGCPSLAPGLRAGRTRTGRAGAPCGDKWSYWGTTGVMGCRQLPGHLTQLPLGETRGEEEEGGEAPKCPGLTLPPLSARVGAVPWAIGSPAYSHREWGCLGPRTHLGQSHVST